jgi:CubicO group peptidase (beta-lactamase class C family)
MMTMRKGDAGMSTMTRSCSRRQVLLGAGGGLVAGCLGARAATSPGWSSTTPAEAGFSADLEARLDKAIAGGRVWGLHGVVIARSGRLVLEKYFAGDDNIEGRGPVGRVAFGAETPHDLRSVTKCIVGLLYGIALAAGKVPRPEEPLFSFFPDYADIGATGGRDKLTIAHALTMTLGTDWPEWGIPYSDPSNSEVAMDAADDRYRFILERPIVAEPGTKWIYNGGATALLGRLIAQCNGKSLPDYARSVLFAPLGLDATQWCTGRDGEPIAASGLSMLPRDLARIGQLVLDDGVWQGRQVVPSSWLQASFRPAVTINEYRRYGYHWYLGELSSDPPDALRRQRWIGGIGYGDQRLFVFPDLQLVVVITAGNYERSDQGIGPANLIRQVILPSIR